VQLTAADLMPYRLLKPNHQKTRNTDDMFVTTTEEQIVRARRK